MERYSTRTIDELGRIVLPRDAIKKLELELGDKLSITPVDSIVILHRGSDAPTPEYVACQISDLGMIELPSELRHKLGWNVKDQLALYLTDNVIILKLAEIN